MATKSQIQMSQQYHSMMTYCTGGHIWSGLLERLGQKVWAQGPTHYQCIIGSREMVKQTKKEIENIEIEVRGASKDGKYRYYERGYMYTTNEEDAIKWKTENERKKLKQFEDHLNYHKTHESTTQKNSTLRFLFEDKQQTFPQPIVKSSDDGEKKLQGCPKKPEIMDKLLESMVKEANGLKLQQKVYHGTTTTWGDNTFWVYSPYRKLQNKWDTHLPVSTYCNHHTQHDANTFKCLGHTTSADFISAQKEWKENGWNEEWSGVENLKEEANDEPEEIFVGKKSYI